MPIVNDKRHMIERNSRFCKRFLINHNFKNSTSIHKLSDLRIKSVLFLGKEFKAKCVKENSAMSLDRQYAIDASASTWEWRQCTRTLSQEKVQGIYLGRGPRKINEGNREATDANCRAVALASSSGDSALDSTRDGLKTKMGTKGRRKAAWRLQSAHRRF